MRKLLFSMMILSLFFSSATAKTVIKLGTTAPKASNWYQILKEMGFLWKEATGGEVTLRILAGGKLGNESEMIKKMRIQQIQAAAISAAGLAEIDRSAYAVMIPLMFESYEEWDYVREEMNQDMEKRLQEKGFHVLTWSDVGWVHFFSKQPMQTPAELEKMKLAASVTQPVIVEITKWAGFRPVPITTADMVAGLQTGLIDAFYVPIYVAEASNLYRYAKNMNGLKWAPLQGAVVIRSEDWNKVGSEHRAKIREIARQIGEKLRRETRGRESASLEAMKKRGLKVWEVDDETRKEWYQRTTAAYPKIRNELLTPEVFDKVLRLREAYRAGKAEGR